MLPARIIAAWLLTTGVGASLDVYDL